ncbi:MAG: 16S rRNA (guanine(966)-N(2))-methyltransferase RsmD [Pseudomonadota bacterium]
MAAERARGTGRVRVIGGAWRGRQLGFDAVAGLRPTADRVREQLFNWLQGELHGARCLDLFAGSGALGIEAASRGAAHVTLVDRHPRVARALGEATATLAGEQAAETFRCHCVDAEAFLAAHDGPWHLVFLDPPFDDPASAELLAAVDARVVPGGWVYHEQRTGSAAVALPQRWHRHRSGRAGDASYALYCMSASDPAAP